MYKPKIVSILSTIALVLTTVAFITLLFIPLEGRFLLIIPFWLFAFLMGRSKGLSITQSRNFSDPLLLLVFLITSFTDFFYDYRYDKKDWEVARGYIYNLSKSKHASGTIYFRFNAQNQLIEDEKSWNIFTHFGKGYRTKDSIYVVYSQSNPSVNDIYSWQEGPEIGERDNMLLYFLKYHYYLKWVLIFGVGYFLFKYLSNKKADYYPLNGK